MSGVSPIVWELGLTIVALVGFAVWQTVTLRRDMRATREDTARREAREAAERERASTAGSSDDT